MEIRPEQQFGDTLKTRFLGAQYRDHLQEMLVSNTEITVNFSGIDGMAHSFADECFGDLYSDFGPEIFRSRIHLVAMNGAVRSVLLLVFADRKRHSRR